MKGIIVMRRLAVVVIALAISICLMSVMPISAQESIPTPPVDDVQALLADAQKALDEAQRANDLAFNLLGLFEATSGAVGIILGIIVPVIAVVAGLFGFSQLASARDELKRARENFEQEMKNIMQKYLDDFNRQFNQQNEELRQSQNRILKNAVAELEATIAEQQRRGANANLALSLLPSAERQYRAQDYQGAIETYQRALALDSQNSIIHYRLGYVFTQKGDLEEAEKHIQEALRLDPQSPQAKAALAYVYRRMGDKRNKPEQSLERDLMYSKSETLFLEVLPTHPKLLDEDGESWWGAFGGLYKRRGQYQLAIEKYELAAQATKSSSYPYSNLAQLYMMTGDTQNMNQMYARVERLAQAEVYADVENYWAYSDLITSRVAQGKFDLAWKVVDEALPTAPADATYPIELLLDTLRDIQKYLPQYADEIARLISHIEQFLQGHQS